MHEYETNSFTFEQEQKLRSSSGSSYYQENFLTQDEFNFCRQLVLDKIAWPEHGKVSKYWGFGWDHGHGPQLTWIKEKINKILPDWELDFFAIQEAIQPWKLHADIRWYKNKLPYKVILMPMDVEPVTGPVDPDNWPETYSISFHQRNFLSLWSDSQRMVGKKTANNQDHWKRPIDNPQIEGIKPGYHITHEQWQKYFSHMPYSHVEGLTLDGIHRWLPRSLFYWDNSAIHCADNFLGNNILTKRSLMIFTVLKQN
jgi:hypothetical protein